MTEYFCLVCLNLNLNELTSFNQVVDNDKTIIDKLKIVNPEIDPNEVNCQKYMCKNCVVELNSCFNFIEKYTKSYSSFKFYKENLHLKPPEYEPIKIEESVIVIEETDRELLRELIKSEANNEEIEQPAPVVVNQFPCYKCSAILPDETYLKHHYQIHENKSIKQVIIPPKTSSANRHKKIAIIRRVKRSKLSSRRLRPKKDNTCCTLCSDGQNCSKKTSDGNLRKCTRCSVIFTSQLELDKHICQVKYQCLRCLKKFQTRSNLEKHNKVHQKKITCKICQRRFVSESLLNDHLKCHESMDGYQCNRCPKCFDNEKDLKKHSVAHAHPCDSCQKSFRSKKLLEQHKVSHLVGKK